jgi:pimeloyl-ACP methyl ester carboxylesterase
MLPPPMAVTPNRRRLIVLIVLLAAAGGWRLSHRAHSLTTGGAATRVGAAETTWQIGELRLQPCTVGKANTQSGVAAWCTRFEVPEDRARPTGRRIGLRVAVIRSNAEKPRADWLVFLDGGPGGAATDDYPQLQGAFGDMARRRHILLVDQRGTGGSNALSCEAADDRSSASSAPADSDTGVVDQRNRIVPDHLAARLNQCLASLGTKSDPAQYTTGAAIADLEALRLALGAPQLNLLGVSYGTRVAQQYATAYPAAVRSVVLDSAVPNTLYLASEHAQNLEASLQAQFARCHTDTACRQRFSDPYAAMHALRRQLQVHPVSVSARDPLTHAPFTRAYGAGDLAATMRLFAYSPLTAALLPLGIDAALKGDITPLQAQEKLIIDVVSERLTDGMGLSVACAEDADGLKHNPADEDTLLGNSLVDYLLHACQSWPRGTRSAGFHQPFRSSAPVLVLAGEFDPVTPPRYAEAIAAGLGNARLLKLRGQGHGVMNAGCMPRLLGQFIDELQPAQLDAACLDRLGYVPAFLSYSGAAP